MRPGAYKLTKDIINPSPDRRRKEWTFWPAIEAGKVFVVDVFGRISMVGERWGDVLPNSEGLGKLLVEFLEPTVETVSTVLRKYGAHHWHVYALPDMLVKHGTLTLEQLDKALEVHHNEPEE